MKILTSRMLLFFMAGTLILCTCAQRDNIFDRESPFYKTSPPILNISLNIDSSKVITNNGDTQYVIIPPARVHFSAQGFDANTKETICVFLKVYHDRDLRYFNKNVSTDSGDLVESRIFVFEAIDESGQITQRQYEFIVNPDSQPKIISFVTKSDTLKTGRYAHVGFALKVLDYGCILDTVKYISQSGIKSFAVEHNAVEFSDTVSLRLFSEDTGRVEILVVIIDKQGRTDTARTSVAFASPETTGNLKPPLIQKIEVSTDDSVKYCFTPVITIFIGDVARVRYYWNFGKGKFSRDRDPCETFNSPGIHKVSLTVEDQAGVVSKESVSVVVPRSDTELPIIKRLNSTPRSGMAPLYVKFNLELSGDQKKIKQINWIFDDGKTKITTCHLYEDNKYLFPGTYYPKVVVYNSAGCDTVSDTIVVSGSEYLQYSPKGEIKTGQKVTFYLDNFKHSEYEYLWSFPDTAFQTSYSGCQYVFENPGSFVVKVSAIPKKGQFSSPRYLGEINGIVVSK